ncbi:hypothetical protein BHM03_00029078 [Ensete ventricosum]|nr:hypothetical protein BHM03_00029078 [Ensete ventricosum]
MISKGKDRPHKSDMSGNKDFSRVRVITKTARYRAIPLKIDCRRSIKREIDRRRSIERVIDHRRSIEEEKGKKKRKRKKKEEGKKEYLTRAPSSLACRRRPRIACVSSPPAVVAAFSHTRGDRASPHAGRKIEATSLPPSTGPVAVVAF